ncbi:MAG TPA: MarR family transcriptional regulator [Solirubrobacterales bacterium]|nr:MarR family transcriptional regulator [Solirubrobacterales bacterium]
MSEQATTAVVAPEGMGPAVSNPHGEAWGALARTHAAVSQRLQDALAQAGFPPLPWYDVLATLADAPEERMRMGDLAEVLVITRGGLTKLVDRLVRAGLLERTFCETDRRVSYATLMPGGSELLEEMRPVVIAELRVAFSAKLSVGEARTLRDTLDRVRSSACGAV